MLGKELPGWIDSNNCQAHWVRPVIAFRCKPFPWGPFILSTAICTFLCSEGDSLFAVLKMFPDIWFNHFNQGREIIPTPLHPLFFLHVLPWSRFILSTIIQFFFWYLQTAFNDLNKLETRSSTDLDVSHPCYSLTCMAICMRPLISRTAGSYMLVIFLYKPSMFCHWWTLTDALSIAQQE